MTCAAVFIWLQGSILLWMSSLPDAAAVPLSVLLCLPCTQPLVAVLSCTKACRIALSDAAAVPALLSTASGS